MPPDPPPTLMMHKLCMQGYECEEVLNNLISTISQHESLEQQVTLYTLCICNNGLEFSKFINIIFIFIINLITNFLIVFNTFIYLSVS